MKVYVGKNVPIKSWCENPEEGALDQARNLASLPFIFKQVDLMPDTHQGYGMPIGGVIATKGVVVPNAVGVDIGCGMCAIKTSLTDISMKQIKKIFGGSKDCQGGIRSSIPVGRNRHSKKQDVNLMPDFNKYLKYDEPTWEDYEDKFPICAREYESALKQLGTLGSGNHFIEIQADTEDNIWIMIHSGSRNLGKQVADYYNKIAKDLNEKWFSEVPKKWDLAFLPLDSKEGRSYLREMQYCVDFALANRKLMMSNIIKIFCDLHKDLHKDFDFEPMINIAHNYASIENHFGQNVVVHRKGATLAREGTIGIIPGSQGTASYIVKGKGNPESFMSCSHGAGRNMSRTKARAELNLEDEQKKLNDLGILHSIRGQSDLDEASSAYKDIDVVMEEQKDLVDIVTKLRPLGVIKG